MYYAKDTPIRISADFLEEMLYARRKYHDIQSAKIKKLKNYQLTILYLTKLSFRIEGENKCFLDKQKIKEFIFIKQN